jgi:Putative peptidoglycan binding domain
MHAARGPAPGGPQPTDRNEFADAVARMFEHRQRIAPDFAPPLRDDIHGRDGVHRRDDVDEWDAPRGFFRKSLGGAFALRLALSVVPVAILGGALVWFFYFEPSWNVTAKPAVEVKPDVNLASHPIELPPQARQEVAEAPMPMPAPTSPSAPAVTPAAPAAPATVAMAVPSRPLSKDEIKELQGKLDAAGFSAGPVDGVVGPQTKAALRRYAQSRHLAKPEATQETLLRLRSETEAGK